MDGKVVVPKRRVSEKRYWSERKENRETRKREDPLHGWKTRSQNPRWGEKKIQGQEEERDRKKCI